MSRKSLRAAILAALIGFGFGLGPVLAQDQGVNEGTPLADLQMEFLPPAEVVSTFDGGNIEPYGSFARGDEYVIPTFAPIDVGAAVEQMIGKICETEGSNCSSVKMAVLASDMNILDRLLAAERAIISNGLEVQIAISSLQQHHALLLAAEAANALAAVRAEGTLAAAVASNALAIETGASVDAFLLEAATGEIATLQEQATEARAILAERTERMGTLVVNSAIAIAVCDDGLPEADPTICAGVKYGQ